LKKLGDSWLSLVTVTARPPSAAVKGRVNDESKGCTAI
jgi:hypothetical protein